MLKIIGLPFRLVGLVQKAHQECFWWAKRKKQSVLTWLYNSLR